MSTDGKDTGGDGKVGSKSMAVLDALRTVKAPGQDQDIRPNWRARPAG